ncbi:Uu.00g026260.m01.CDS01 [Anthostomella pinea]|uniref:Uu.00g026260.m01.CDS01 n=1 Tax=Anthostomella pinea TaxID=933095 RepID=A0AAI8YCQ3_9PEZI|nr:Uu.00g026260.m01.CDS01 [Anthostomella pinea]
MRSHPVPDTPSASRAESEIRPLPLQHDSIGPAEIVAGPDSLGKTAPLNATNEKVVIADLPAEGEEAFAHLPPEERGILRTQLDQPSVKVSFFSLYRYADFWDLLITATSALCAIAAGAALPLLSILFGQLATSFSRVAAEQITYSEFEKLLVQNVLYYVYVGIAEFFTIYIATVGFIYAGARITLKIREQYLRAILRQNMAYFDNLGAGEITTRITADTNLIQDGISQKVGLTLTAVATFVSAVIIAYTKFWKLALICTPTILGLVGAMVIGYRFIVKYTGKSLGSVAVGGSVAGEVLGSIRTATAFGSHNRLAKQYEVHLKEAKGYAGRMQIVQALMVASLGAIMFMTYGLAFWRGSRFLVAGEVAVGQVLTILMAVITGSYNLGSVAPHGQAFTSALAAAAKIYSTIDRQSPLDPTSIDKSGRTLEDVKGALELRNIKHVYPSRPEVTVLDNLSLHIPAGRTTAFVGPSGSGKSTVISLVERFYIPVRGDIFLDGHSIASLNLRWLRQQISLVSQEPVLFSTTIYENIRFGLIGSPFEHEPPEKIRHRIEEAATMANAHKFVTGLPDGYQTRVGEQGFLLSGGQKQRIAIARAVVSDPKILLLDEATSALDTKSEGIVQAALDKAAEGRTTIVIAHRLSTIKSAHNIVVLVDGRVVQQGTHEELLSSTGEYFDLVEAQRLHQDREPYHTEVGESEYEHDAVEDALHSKEMNSSTPPEKSAQIDGAESGGLPAEVNEQQAKKASLFTLIKFIGSFNRPELKIMMVGAFAVIISGGGQPTQAIFYSKAITTFSRPPELYKTVVKEADFWSAMLLMLGIIHGISLSVHGIIFGLGAEKLIYRARSQAFRTFLRQDIAFFDRDENTAGALLSFLSTETKHLAGISGLTLGTILMILTSLTAAFVIALVVGWKMALVCISIVPIVLFCGFMRVAMIAQFQIYSRKAYEGSASYACEATMAIRTVASLCREDDVLATYRDQLDRQAKAGIVPSLKSSLFYALSQGIYCLCTALGFWYGGTLLGKHEYTVFQFFVCFTEVIYGANAAGSIFSNAPDMAKAKIAAADFKQLFDRRPQIDPWSEEGEMVGNDVKGSIEFRDVHFRYPTRPAQAVLQGLSLSVKPGQYVALVGASGCGKSTTIALIERFYDVSSGGVYLDGKDVSKLNVNSYRSHLALVSQEPVLYQGTIRENICLGSKDPDVPDESIVEACRQANIWDTIVSLPDGLKTMVGSKGSLLSGGQKQRIAIARALLRDPRILLLDEATSALDSESEKVVQAALDAAARGRTTVAVAHRLSTIQKADVIYVLDQGHVAESGTHQELIRNRRTYYEMVNLQSMGNRGSCPHRERL